MSRLPRKPPENSSWRRIWRSAFRQGISRCSERCLENWLDHRILKWQILMEWDFIYVHAYIYIHSLNQFDDWFFNHYNAERPRKPLAVLINLKPWYGHPGPLVPGFHIRIIHYSDLFGPERYYITISLPCCRIFLNGYSQSQMPQTKYIHIMWISIIIY